MFTFAAGQRFYLVAVYKLLRAPYTAWHSVAFAHIGHNFTFVDLLYSSLLHTTCSVVKVEKLEIRNRRRRRWLIK